MTVEIGLCVHFFVTSEPWKKVALSYFFLAGADVGSNVNRLKKVTARFVHQFHGEWVTLAPNQDLTFSLFDERGQGLGVICPNCFSCGSDRKEKKRR